MAIKNQDGSGYQLSGSLQQFDPENQELDLINQWDQELIEIVGSPLYYYEVVININGIDELYVEARDKFWSPCHVCLYGYYESKPSQAAMTMFGWDSAGDEMMFEFNYSYVMATLGYLPKIGSRLFTPHRNENWKIVNRHVTNFNLWGKFRLQLLCERFQESLTTGEGKVTQKAPDIKMNQVKDLGSSCSQ